ncbi:MAG: polysaccharide biosynthesis C-terminal domain-containing protein [Bacteroidia bacterium]|nr:polysaccharide biosynthesis C-terminal domain-containing protein [Bacteroidia bacterium]
MRALLKKLTTDSAIYGVSNILGRFITFLLVPFYTHMLPQGDYGIVIVVYAYIAFLNGIFTFGLEPAYMRFVAEAGSADRSRVFSAAFWFILVAGAVLAIPILSFSSSIQPWLGIRPEWAEILPLSLAMVLLDAVCAIPFAALRMENRPRSFAGIRLFSIVLNVGLNFLLIAVWKWSVVAVFISGAVSSASCLLLLLPTLRGRLRFSVDRALLRRLLVYGLPTMPGAISIMLIEIIDKPIMLLLTDAATVGLYGANYKLGIFMMLVVSVFRYAWQPFYLQLASDPGAKALFSRVMTYFVLIGSVIVLLLSLFIGELVQIPLPRGRTLIPAEYWSGLGIVPIILFSYLFAGMDQILSAGIYIQKRTMIVLYATASGALVNIVANFLLIPVFGIYGAAFATLAAYFTLAAVYWVAGRKIYPITWENARLLKLFGALAVPALLWYLVPMDAVLPMLLWKIFLVALYVSTLAVSGFFSKEERNALQGLLRGARRSERM